MDVVSFVIYVILSWRKVKGRLNGGECTLIFLQNKYMEIRNALGLFINSSQLSATSKK